MSLRATEMLHKYLDKHSISKSKTEVNNAIQSFKEDSEKRNKDLIEFLNEFVSSEEYEQYLESKRNIRTRHVSTQYSLQDLEAKEPTMEEKYPLTTESRKMFMFKRHFNKYISNKSNMELVKRQEKGIQTIKVSKMLPYHLLS